MKKYIYTEAQLKNVLDHFLTEQVIVEEFGKVLKLKDLAEIASRTGNDYETLLQIFIKVFKDAGDEGVIDLFRQATDLEIEDMGYGRYMLK